VTVNTGRDILLTQPGTSRLLIRNRELADELCNHWVIELCLSDALQAGDERLLEDYEIKQLIMDQLNGLQPLGITCRIVDVRSSPE